MNSQTADIISELASDIVTLAQVILQDAEDTFRNSALSKEISTKIQTNSDSVVVQALFNNYITYIEQGRPKEQGKQPPLDSLRDWALARGIPTDNSTLFLIARAIWHDGYEGKPILATLENEVAESFDKEYFEKIYNALIYDLTKFFN